MDRVLNEAEKVWLRDVFHYHTPSEAQLQQYIRIRDGAGDFARVVMLTCPPSADRSAALRKIREAVMTANASIALEGKG